LAFGCQRREPSVDGLAGADVAQPAAPVQAGAPAEENGRSVTAAAPLARPREPLNVLLLSVDALRADMPWSGYPREVAPNLSVLARESAVWAAHRSVASYTAQTVATLLSGQYASSVYRDGYFFTGFSEHNVFFTETLQARGIKTVGVHAHMYFGKDKGLGQGFDVWETVPGISFDAQTDNHVTSPKSAARIMEILAQPEYRTRQFFLWSHFMDPHDKYILHEEAPNFGKKNRDRYDSEVFFTDLWLGKLLEFARAQPWWSRTAVIITGDHGEAFGEHGMYKHAFDLWDVLVRVPLIIRAPGAAPIRITRARTHIDLAPTILDLMGVPPLEQFAGRSLVPEMYGAAAEASPVLLELAEDSHNPGLRAVVDGDYKLIVQARGGAPRLFNLRDDPGELNNLARSEPEKLAELSAALERGFREVPNVEPYGGMKLHGGRRAGGHDGPKE
jgi:arylsulfatase A-like enzyme